MKPILKIYVTSTLSLYLASVAFAGIELSKGINSILIAAVALSLFSLLVKPLINLLLLPLNLITFGLFRWVSSAIALYLVTLVVPGFKIVGFIFNGLSSKWLDIPSVSLPGILAIVAFSLVISIISSILHWLISR
jgi:putative membrane protein